MREERRRNQSITNKISVYLFQSFGLKWLALVGLLFFRSIHSNLLNTPVWFKNWRYVKAKYEHTSSSLFSLTKAVAKILHYLAPCGTNYTNVKWGVDCYYQHQKRVLFDVLHLPSTDWDRCQRCKTYQYPPTCLSWQKAFWLKYRGKTMQQRYTLCFWCAAFIKLIKASWLTIPIPVHPSKAWSDAHTGSLQ